MLMAPLVTWGSLVVLPAAWLGPLPCLVLAAGVALAGWWAVAAVLAEGGEQDPGWIVVDEAAGMLLTLAALPIDAGWVGVLAAFAAFRALDILKPWPVRSSQRLRGGLGVTVDDVLAGVYVALITLLFVL